MQLLFLPNDSLRKHDQEIHPVISIHEKHKLNVSTVIFTSINLKK